MNKRTALFAILMMLATMSFLSTISQAQTPHLPMTDPDVIRMVRDKMPESAIIARIQSGPVNFDLSPGGLALLRQGNVSPNIVRAMMAAGKPGGTPVGSATPTPTAAGNVPGTPSTPSGTVPGGKTTTAGTGPTRAQAPGKRSAPVLANIKITTGPKIKIAGAASPSITPTIVQALQQQSSQTHADKTSSPVNPGVAVAPASRPVMIAGRAPAGTPAGGIPTGASATPPGAAGPASVNQKLTHAPQPISACMIAGTNPVIQTVSGKNRGVVFTPDPGSGPNPNNQYTIRGCNFGQAQGQGQVHLFGPFINHPSPVRLDIDSWSDNLIVVSFDPTFQDEYDLSNITLVVVASNGQNVQLPGQSFVAARASRPLTRVPQSLVSLPPTSLEVDKYVSPVTPATLKAANMGTFPQAVTIAYYQYGPLWDTPNTSDHYPQNRVSWSELVDTSKLRAGFALDSDIQTYSVFIGNLNSHDAFGVGGGDCKYFDTPLSASVQNNKLNIGVQPAECDNYGKYIVAYYGLALSVVGPKGSKLNPWPDNL